MDMKEIWAVCFLFLIAADVSNASPSLSKLRMLLVAIPKESNSNPHQLSPSPSPDPVQIEVNNNQTSNKTTSKDVGSQGLNFKNDSNKTGDSGVVGVPSRRKSDNKDEKSDEAKKNNDGEAKAGLQPEVGENCNEGSRRCTDQKSMVACVLSFDSESKQLLVLVQNQGDRNLSVDLTGLNPMDSALLEVYNRQRVKVNLTVGTRTEVILNAGNGECILHLDPPVSMGNFFLNLPSYEQLVTPINGAYFLIITVIVFGVMWALCMFRKRRRQGGIPYQELEMSFPESGVANNVETAEVWDQGWDDDWDEENAVKSPAARHAGSISANGLTSRPTNKDGWENDWDG